VRRRVRSLTASSASQSGLHDSPTGRFVVVAGEKSDTLSSYAIDAKLIGRYPTGKGANWIEILAFD
jgi:6-phosphogluconolactonase